MGNGKRVPNKIFLTDARHAQEPQGSEDVVQGDQQEVVAEVHHEEEVEEGAVGGQDLEIDEDPEDQEDEEEDKEKDKDDTIDDLVASGHIKMVSKWVVKWVTIPPADQAGNKTKTYFFLDSAGNQGFCSC